MNRLQRVVLAVLLAVVALFCIVPPWYCQIEGSAAAMGYGPLWSPPPHSSHIDLGRLMVQIVAAVVLGAAFYFLRRGRGEVSKTVCAQEFRLVDKDGKARAKLCLTGSGLPSLELSDQNDKVRAGLGLGGDGLAVLSLSDRNGTPRAILCETLTGQPTLCLADESGKRRALLNLGESGQPELCLNDQNGKTRAELTLDESGQPRLRLYDQSDYAVPRAALFLSDESEQPILSLNRNGKLILSDQNGKAIWSAP